MKMPIMLLRGVIVAVTLTGADAAFAMSAIYKCTEGVSFTARFSPPNDAMGQVVLTFGDGRSLTLPQVVSADGGRYAAGDVEFWIKGKGATFKRGAKTRSCSTR